MEWLQSIFVGTLWSVVIGVLTSLQYMYSFYWCASRRNSNLLQMHLQVFTGPFTIITYCLFYCFSESKRSRRWCLSRSWSSRERQADGFCLPVSWFHLGPLCHLSLRASSNTQRHQNLPHRPGIYWKSYFRDPNGGSYRCWAGWKTSSHNDVVGSIFFLPGL